jgi:hypothetical protein
VDGGRTGDKLCFSNGLDERTPRTSGMSEKQIFFHCFSKGLDAGLAGAHPTTYISENSLLLRRRGMTLTTTTTKRTDETTDGGYFSNRRRL